MADEVTGGNLRGEILTNYVWVYDSDDGHGQQIKVLKPGDVVDIYNTNGNWIKHSAGGYSMYQSDDGQEKYIRIFDTTKPADDAKTTTTNGTDTNSAGSTIDDLKKNSDYTSSQDIDYSTYTTTLTEKKNSIYSNFLTKVDGVYGMPYQFMDSVDPKLPGSDYGEVFTDVVISRMPLLLLSPGKPMFMQDYTAKQKQDVLQYIKDGLHNTIDDLLDNKEPGKYYSFGYNYQEFYQYVNPMCQSAAQFLGIGSKLLDGTELQHYKWQNYTNSALRNFVSSNESLAFYIESPNQVSESFSNNVGESSLASKVNEMSDLSREVQFLLGGLSGMDFSKFQANVDATKSDLNAFAAKYLNGSSAGNLIKNLVDTGLTTVVTGGKMIFPEIWKDSTYSNDYDVTVKLRTPDCDLMSWYMNICVPMMMLVCLVAPQSMGQNAYKSPFLIKGFYKGLFNCQMGIITNMSISKGDKGSWTLGGLPTQVDVSFTIKDLYNTLTLSKTSDGLMSMDFVKNTYLVDWIANNCGININKPDILRRIDLWMNMMSNNAYNKVTFDGFMGIKQDLTNLVNGFFKR